MFTSTRWPWSSGWIKFEGSWCYIAYHIVLLLIKMCIQSGLSLNSYVADTSLSIWLLQWGNNVFLLSSMSQYLHSFTTQWCVETSIEVQWISSPIITKYISSLQNYLSMFWPGMKYTHAISTQYWVETDWLIAGFASICNHHPWVSQYDVTNLHFFFYKFLCLT